MVVGSVLLLLFMGLWVYALVDCVTTDPAQCRNLPKVAWLVIVFFVPLLGSLLWLGWGRPATAGWAAPRTAPARRRPSSDLGDHPRSSATAGISDRRSAELDRQIEEWERRQREERGEPDA
jgi:hypothetical protein